MAETRINSDLIKDGAISDADIATPKVSVSELEESVKSLGFSTESDFAKFINWQDRGVVVDVEASAYYPSFIYSSDLSPNFVGFYSNGTKIFKVTSSDGVTWGEPVECTGLDSTAHHPHVAYEATAWGDIKFKIWYWDSSVSNLLISTIRYAESEDGVTWVNDQAITQDSTLKIITGNSGDWNAGTWGFQKVFFNASATNTGDNPFDYSYTAYYDANTGTTYQSTGIAYSVDGLEWFGMSNPVLTRSSDSTAWDFYTTSFASFFIDPSGKFHCWYTGGRTAGGYTDNFGIGYATSLDGLVWEKHPLNPIFTVLDGKTYRDQRCYTPSVISVGNDLYMYYTATGSDVAYKRLGLAICAKTQEGGFNPFCKNGISCVFTTVDEKTVTVVNGLIVKVE